MFTERKIIFLLQFVLNSILSAQTPYIVSGIDTTLINYEGYVIPTTNPISLIVKNSRFVSGRNANYILQAGDDDYTSETAGNLDNAIITGNKFVWTGYGTYPESVMHTIMAGYNINYHIKFNYFESTRYAVVFESSDVQPMVYTSGGFSYNILNNDKLLIVAGLNGLKIYNNTFYNSWENYDQIIVKANLDGSPSLNIKIKNNIFYRKTNGTVITVAAGSETGFVCDYNIYWNEGNNGYPKFYINGGEKTWAQWRALGFDTHSVIMNPNFIDTISFVPSIRLPFGTDLGKEFEYGLSPTVKWVVGQHPDTIQQGNTWQVGALIYKKDVVSGYRNTTAYDNLPINIFPNPAKEYITVRIEDPALNPNIIQIINLSGKIVFLEELNPDLKEFTVPLNLQTGIYIIKLASDNLTLLIQKLIVRN